MTVVADGQTTAGAGRDATDAAAAVRPRCRSSTGRPWGAVTAKELRYVGREPRRKVNLVNSIIVGVGCRCGSRSTRAATGGARRCCWPRWASYIAVLGSSNQFGLDGPAAWLDMVAGDTMRTVLIGKNVAVAIEVLPIVTVVGAVRRRHHRRVGLPARAPSCFASAGRRGRAWPPPT